jgi:hypothetical protein
MKYASKISILLFSTAIIVTNCNVNSTESKKPKVFELESNIAATVRAKDVVQTGGHIYIFGQAKANADSENFHFYLAEIDLDGKLLWEKIYKNEFDAQASSILAKDGSLLLVGGGIKQSQRGKNLFVIKADYSGKIIWKNNYVFSPDRSHMGGNTGLTATEVMNGYVIGGEGVISRRELGIGASALTKIGFDGHIIWSKALNGYLLYSTT